MQKIAAVLLAAGCSRRFGDANKLVAHLHRRPVVRLTAQAVADSRLHDLVVVTGYDQENVEAALGGLPLRLVHNAQWSAGMGTSISTGLRALNPDIDAAFIVPGDMPLLTTALLGRLVERFVEAGADRIVVPTTSEGEQRNPVLWPRRHFPDLISLSGHEGGKQILRRHWSTAVFVPVEEARVFADIDTASDLARMPHLK